MVAARLILASASPRRAALLSRLRLPFETRPVDIDETLPADEALDVAIAALAERKARACVAHFALDEGVVLAADTLVLAGGEVLGKPANIEEAHAMVGALSGQRHEVYTGVCLLDARRGTSASFTEITSVTFAPMRPADIAWIVANDQPLDRAGGCDIEGCAGCFIKSIEGCYDNVMGLPVSRVRSLLVKKFGFFSAHPG